MHILHPRSRSTSTLFTTTLAVSFLVVALPHLLPCPVDRRQFADSADNENAPNRKRLKRNANNEGAINTTTTNVDEDARPKRECPVPKPTGLVGQIMGFKQTQQPKAVEVVVHELRSADVKQGKESDAPP